MTWNFQNTYIQLPAPFYHINQPETCPHSQMVAFNEQLANELGLSSNNSDLSLPAGTQPLSQAYAGHQFGHFNMLGDGRAHLLGEHISPEGRRFDLQLKGSGQSAFSRRGDGRAALGPMLREYIISEAMHHLGVPTTRSLAVIKTGRRVYRDKEYPGAVLARIASSHIRVGTFQYAATLSDPNLLRTFADYTIQRHDPESVNSENPYLDFLKKVIDRQAKLIAQWMSIGFIHGVMNTDNMAISGETLDYGPCAFMDHFDSDTVFSSIDQQGRYAYGNQAEIGKWNLTRLAETLIPLIDQDTDLAIEKATEVLKSYEQSFSLCWQIHLRAKLGFLSEKNQDAELIISLFTLMQKNKPDFTNTFRELSDHLAGTQMPKAESIFINNPEFKNWLENWKKRITASPEDPMEIIRTMNKNNPSFIPRNHLVEEAISAAVENNDFSYFEKINAVLAAPYRHGDPSLIKYQQPGGEKFRHYKTFCGT